MAYDLATVTNLGNQLLASVVSDKSSLVIDKIEVSGTQLASSTGLKSMKSISNVVKTLSANGYQKKDTSFIISTVLDNSGVTADYKAWVFGIWAHEADGGSPILMSVITSTSSPDTISKGSGTPIDYNYKFITTFSNTNSLTIQMASDTYATNDTVLHNSGDETATGTKTFQEIKISNDKFPSLVQTDGQYITLDGGNTEIVPADNSKVIHTTGDETINGQKKFKTDPTDGAGNAYAKTVDVNQQLDKKVNVSDMRKPASDVAGIEEVSAGLSTKVTDNKDGTEQLSGVQVQPFNKLSDTIGGRNLLINTAQLNDSTVCLDTTSNISDTYLGLNIFQTNGQWSGVRIYWSYLAPKLKTETNYVMSEYVRNTSPTTSASIGIYGLDARVKFNSLIDYTFATLPPNSGWVRISSLVNIASYPTTIINGSKLRFENATNLTDGYVQFSGLKLEQGSIATDWTPAPEDKVNVTDMRKPASDVAGIEEVNAKQDKIGYTPADDSKVVHSTDTSNWQKQAMFNPGSYMITSTTIAKLDFKTLLTTKFSDAGIYYIRDDYNSSVSVVNSVVISEGRGWWYSYGIDFSGDFVYRQINPSTDTGWVKASNDGKVAHLSGANNFDTVPTVNNNPLLLASSLPSDLARTGSDQEFTGKNTFDTAPIDKTTGNPYITAKAPGIPKLAVTYNATSKAFDYTLTAPEKDGLSDIIQYNLLWKDHSVDDWTTVIVKPDALTGQLTGVDITKTYDFKAAAQNAVGSSEFTNVITLGTVDSNIYGVSWDGSSSGVLQRTDAAVGLKAGINGAQNDFDNVGPWKGMHRVTDSMNNVFVRIPKFYIRKTQTGDSDNGKATWQVSLASHGDDWYLPKGFWDFTNSKELDYIDIGAYDATGSSSKLTSVAGKAPLINLSIVNFRSAAKANGTGYQIWDIHANDMLQVLFIIEFATLNSQSIMEGSDNGPSTANSGAADSHKGSSGTAGSGSNAMSYRGIENLYGNVWQFCDGVNFKDNQPWVCEDATNYQSDLFASPYVRTSYTATSDSANNYIKALGFDSVHPYAQFATDDSGSGSTYYADYDYPGSGNTILETGGGWGVGAGGGLFVSYRGDSSTYADAYDGCRLLKKALP